MFSIKYIFARKNTGLNCTSLKNNPLLLESLNNGIIPDIEERISKWIRSDTNNFLTNAYTMSEQNLPMSVSEANVSSTTWSCSQCIS